MFMIIAVKIKLAVVTNRLRGVDMKVVTVQEAVGMVLGQDMTQIIPGEFKGVAFRKGHIVSSDDIPRLLDMGKKHLYVFDLNKGNLHENEAAAVFASAVSGPGTNITEAKEGRVNITASGFGLLKVDKEAMLRINECDQAMMASLHSNQIVSENKLVAAAKIIPLVIPEKKIHNITEIAREAFPVIQVKPFAHKKTGLIITGSEVFHGRIKDGFGPVIEKKLAELGSSVFKKICVLDDSEMISNAICSLISQGAEMVIVTGGMAVDPDDVTPMGIRMAGGRLVTYGTPSLPGAMFMLAYLGNIPVMGLPGCVMFHKSTVFDLVLPRILAGEEFTRKDFVAMGYGGLCVNCTVCKFPDCSFGKN